MCKPAVDKSETEAPVPYCWRSALFQIVSCLVKQDYGVSENIEGLEPVPRSTSEQIEKYITDYGETLVELAEGSWETSVCIWQEGYWMVLVDLWTVNEGASDLVLQVKVFESGCGYRYQVDMVYVP